MRISLINARNSDSTVTPYGLLCIAAVLEKEGHEVQVFDPFFGNLSFINGIIDFKPDLIGISALTASYTQAKNIAATIRSRLPNVKLCMGGIHATALPERTLKDLPIDFVVLGEGELALSEICSHPETLNSLDSIEGVAFLKNGYFVQNPRKLPIENLDSLPFPAWHLLPIEKYFIPPGYIRSYFLERTLVVYSSRGCPYGCIFCASHEISGYKIRRHSVDYFFNHLSFIIEKYKLDGIYIMDDTFTLDEKWLISFCAEKKRRKMNVLWGCQGRVDTVDEDKLLMLKAAGCIQIDFGVESGSQRVLNAIKKGISVQDIERAFKLCHKIGIRPYASIMVGNPEEEEADIILTERLIKRIKPVYCSVVFSHPVPGSELYSIAKKHNWFDDTKEFYGSHWDLRLSKEPIMLIKFNKEQLKNFRARLQNSCFISNYLSFINLQRIPFILSLLTAIIKEPRNFIRAIKKSLYTHKIDDIIDFILYTYRIKMMKLRIKTLTEL